MKIPVLMILAVAVSLVGCAHSAMRGSVAMKVSDEEAHVCLGQGEVKEGDKVTLFTNQCTPRGGKTGAADRCRKVPAGEGVISQILNEHYSLMKVSKGTPIEEGTIVEKATK